MALARQNLSVSFAGGVDTKTDYKQVMPNEFLTLENCIFQTLKKIKKRNGYDKLGTLAINNTSFTAFPFMPTNINSGSFIANYNDELVMGDGLNFFSYSESNDSWQYKARLTSCGVSKESIQKDQNNNLAGDSAYNTLLGIEAYAWEINAGYKIPGLSPAINSTNLGIGYSVFDSNTQQLLFSNKILATVPFQMLNPRVISVFNKLYVTYFDSNAGRLKIFSVTQAGAGATFDLITNINTAQPIYDVLVVGNNFYVAYSGTGGTVKVASFDYQLNPLASTSKAEVASNGISIFGDPALNVWIAYNNGTQTKAFIMNAALTVTVLAPTIVDGTANATNCVNVTGIYDGTQGIIFYDNIGAPLVLQPDLFSTTANYVQPAVGSSVAITGGFVAPATQNPSSIGPIIWIPTGGYYWAISSPSTGAYTIVNLGYPGNAAPGTVILFPQAIYAAGALDNSVVYYNTLTSAGVVGAPHTFTLSAALGSKAFLKNSIAHVVVTHDALLQPTYFLCNLYNIKAATQVHANYAAKILESVGPGIQIKSMLPSVNLLSTGDYKVALPEVAFSNVQSITTGTTNAISNIFFTYGISAIDITFTPVITKQSLGNDLQIGMGMTSLYDGASVSETGFNLFPEGVEVIAGAGGALDAGTYGYQIIYAWTDNKGQKHRSAPSVNISVVVPANGLTLVRVPTLRNTNKTNVNIEVYRTEANGSVYHRIDQALADPLMNRGFAIASWPIINDPTTNFFPFTDSVNDLNIASNEIIYTTGQVQNDAPPPALFIASSKNRLVLIPSDSPTQWAYTKEVVPGTPAEFSNVFVNNSGIDNNPLIAAAQLDDKLILFKESIILAVAGTGPSDSGANNDFTEPFFIASDVGCIDPNSVILMPYGLMFKSAKGIYLLDRSLAVNYIGDKVEAYNQYSISSAQLLSSVNQVRFIISNGTALVYDYYVKKWSVFTNFSAIDATISKDVYYYLNSSGGVFQETAGVFSDNGTPIIMKVVTAWLSLAGIQGYQRIYRALLLGDYISPHKLQIYVAYDFNPSYFQGDLIDPNSILNTSVYGDDTFYGGSVVYGGLGLYPVYQWQIDFARQKCESIQLTIYDVETTASEGLALSDITVEVGVKQGLNKMSPLRSFG